MNAITVKGPADSNDRRCMPVRVEIADAKELCIAIIAAGYAARLGAVHSPEDIARKAMRTWRKIVD